MFGSDTVVICSYLLSKYISCFLPSKPMPCTASRSQDLFPSVIYLEIRSSVEELERFKVSKQTQIFVNASPREPFRSSVASAFCAVRPKWVKPNSAHNESAVNVRPWSGEHRRWQTAATVLSLRMIVLFAITLDVLRCVLCLDFVSFDSFVFFDSVWCQQIPVYPGAHGKCCVLWLTECV